MVNRIICAKWGDEYTDDDVRRLEAQIAKHCSVEYTFHVFNDFSEYLELDAASKRHFRGYHHNHDEEGTPFYYKGDLGGVPHWRKITLFDQDKMFDDGDKILYLDLDSVIKSDLARLFELPMEKKPYIVWNYWWEGEDDAEWLRQYHITRCPLYNSSVMMWIKGAQKPIYDFVIENKNEVFFTYPSMDTFMFHQFGPYSNVERASHYQYFPMSFITTEREETMVTTPVVHMLEGLNRDDKRRILDNIPT